MRHSWRRVLIALVVFVAVSSIVGAFVFALVTADSPTERLDSPWALAWIGFPIVGGLIARQPRANRVGLILTSIGAMVGFGLAGQIYAQQGLMTEPGSIPLPEIALWISTVVFPVAFGLLPLLLLHFPTGSIRSKAVRIITRLIVAVTIAITICYGLRPFMELVEGRRIDNPFGIDFLGGPIAILIPPLFGALVASAIFAVGNVIYRMVRSEGIERLQLKWFAYAAAVWPLLMLGASFTEEVNLTLSRILTLIAFVFGFNGIAAAIGVAVVRYHLYEIDRVINRTLVYVSMTVMVVALYAGIVVLLQRIIRPLTASSDLAIVASTLAVATIFNPLRKRIQVFVDRRFYRRKYNAQRTVESFSARLRDEVDLRILERDLGAVVNETFQPSAVSLWVRSSEEAT